MQHDVNIALVRHRARHPRHNFERALGTHDKFVVADPHPELPTSQRAHAGFFRVSRKLMDSAGDNGERLESDGGGDLDGVVGCQVGGGECQC